MHSAAPEATRKVKLSRFLPDFGGIILLFPLLMVLAHPSGLSFLLKDGDTGLHIRTGEWILAHGKVPASDLYSFTRPNQEWFAWEWLWDVSFAALHTAWGLSAVALASLLVLCATFYLAYNVASARCGNPFIAFFVTWLCMINSWQHWLARPHLITLLFATIAIWWIEKHRESPRWLIPPLMILVAVWANLHGGFVFIFIILGAYTFGAFLGGLGRDRQDRTLAFRSASTFLSAGLLCLIASAANPYGISLHKHVFQYLSDPSITSRTLEFKPPGLSSIWMMGLFSLDALATAWLIYKERYASALLVAGTGGMALTAIRHVALHCALAAPFLCESATELAKLAARRLPQRALRDLLAEVEDIGRECMIRRRGWGTLALPAVVIAAAVLLSAKGSYSRFHGTFHKDDFPVAAVSTLAAGDQVFRVFSDDEIGDYVVYALYPRARVFWDGRLDFYGPGILAEYDRIIAGTPGWRVALRRHKVDKVLLRLTQPLTNLLREEAGWQLSYEDGTYAIFTRNDESKD